MVRKADRLASPALASLLKTGHVPSGKDILAVSATAPIEFERTGPDMLKRSSSDARHSLRSARKGPFLLKNTFLPPCQRCPCSGEKSGAMLLISAIQAAVSVSSRA